MTSNISVGPAYGSPLLHELFSGHQFHATALPNMATMSNPANGFLPTHLPSGTDVLWISDPARLGVPFGAQVTPLWQQGLGLVLFRHEANNCMGAIFIHGAMKTPWSAYGTGSWHALGGIMAFSGLSFEKAIEMVLGKGYAMTPKWRFIDLSLSAAEHPTLTHLGGGKAIIVHGSTEDDKRKAVAVSAEVTDALGIYISGPDQNMDTEWCREFARLAPRNFVGSDGAEGKYRGMKPSKHTARGVFRGIKVVCEELIGNRPPIFFEGYGGVGKVMVALAVENGFPVSGLAEAEVDRLLGVQRTLPGVPLFLNARAAEENFGRERRDQEVARARQDGITVVENLEEALQAAPTTVILSPNAGPHPISMGVATRLIANRARAVVGAANNMLDLVNGSSDPIAQMLLKENVFVPNDSRINRIGALACMVDMVELDRAVGLALQIRQVGEDVREEIGAYRRGTTPQSHSDHLAALEWNQALDSGRAIGGRFPV